MEAATCGTPSAALRIGGLPESIVDGETGLLADDGPGLTAAVQRLVADPELRARMGDGRARARRALHLGAHGARVARAAAGDRGDARRCGCARSLGRSETLKAVGMAAATMANNVLALIFTVLFARLLGAEDYGSLAALVSTFVILAVPGSAVQVAVAREIALGRLGEGPRLAATLSIWRRRLLLIGVAVTAARGAPAPADRRPDLGAGGVGRGGDRADRACCGCCCRVERGALQGAHLYKPVAWSIVLEAFGRLVFGLLLVALGLGVTGAYLGTPLSLAATALGLWWISRKRLGVPAVGGAARRLRDLVGGAWPAVLALFLMAVLQNVDVILVKRQIGGEAAGAYAAAAVAAKAVVWVAIGIGLYLLPEATRAARHGQDPRPVLARALAVVGRGRGADADRLRADPGDRAAAGLRPRDGRRRRRAARARDRDDAAGRRLPRRPVHARAGPGRVPARAGRGRGGRDRPAGRDRHRLAAGLRRDRARPAGRGARCPCWRSGSPRAAAAGATAPR